MRAFVVALVLVAAVVSGTELWEMEPLEALDPVNFTLTNCGDPNTDFVVVRKAQLDTPMPIKQGDYVMGSFAVSIVNDMANISASLLIEKQLTKSQWIKVPCLGEVGSCSYPDVCSELSKIPDCSQYLGQECQCPIKAREFNLDNFKYGPIPKIPSMLRGNFRVTLQAMETVTKKRAACYVATLSIH